MASLGMDDLGFCQHRHDAVDRIFTLYHHIDLAQYTMKNYARRLKLIGEIWLGLGTIIIVWGALYLFGISWTKMLPFRFSDPAANLFDTLYIRPWTEVTAIAIGLLLIVSGCCQFVEHAATVLGCPSFRALNAVDS